MRQDGFSLLELLMASMVVAAAGALLVGGMVWANRGADLRIEQVLSTQLLASQLALLDGPLSPQTPRSGTCPAPLNEFTWTLQWKDAPLAPLAEATLTVGRNGHTAHVVTYQPITEP